jgi:hypothetical protein
MRSHSLLVASFAFLTASGVLGSLAGCGDDAATPAANVGGAAGSSSTAEPNLDNVVYEGGATDEALVSVLGVAATVDEAKAPAFSEPAADGQTYAAATPPTFAWAALVASARPAPTFPDVPNALERLVTIRSAHAHGTANSGPVYLLDFTNAKGETLFRVFTTATTYTPSAAAWAKLTETGGALSLKLTAARVEDNDLVASGGPFVRAAGRTFSITP